MRQKPTRDTLAQPTDVERPADRAGAIPQPWAATAANDSGRPDETGVLGPQHFARGLPPPQQDVDWDNDATTSFRRLDDPRWMMDDPSWSGDLSSLLEPDAYPEQLAANAAATRASSPQRRGMVEAKPANRSQQRAQPQSRAPLPRPSLFSSPPPRTLSDSPSLAIEGSLARSMRPRRSNWVRSLWFVLPMLAVFGADAWWNGHGASRNLEWWPFGTTPQRNSASQAERPPQLNAPVTPPSPLPAAVAAPEEPPAPAIPGAIDPAELAAELAELEAIPDEPQVKQEKPARLSRAGKAAQRRRAREARRAARNAAVARPITPLADAPEEDDITPPGTDGVLQINSRPWARVLVDGQFVGHTPQRALRLAPGRHRVRLENEPMEMSKSFEVTIAAGQTVTRVEMLEEDGAP